MQVTPSSERLSQLVSAARFPLMMLVVLIHVPLPEHAIPALPLGLPLSASAWYFYVSRIISFGIGAMAVPMFFLFSGYYMFFKPKAWNDASVYLGELKKRFKVLVIPYFFWCSLALLSHLLLETLGSGGVQGLSLDPQRLLHAYLLEPANFPLWYLRDLIFLCSLAPLVYWIARRAPWLVLLIYCVYLWHGANVSTWWNFTGAVYFTLGAVFGLRSADFVALAVRLGWIPVGLFLLMSFALPFLPMNGTYTLVQGLYIPLASVTFLRLGYLLYERRSPLLHWAQKLEHYVFFIYVAHEVLILSFVRGFLFKRGWLETLPGYFLCGFVVLGICILLYEVLVRLAQPLLSWSLGGRVSRS